MGQISLNGKAITVPNSYQGDEKDSASVVRKFVEEKEKELGLDLSEYMYGEKKKISRFHGVDWSKRKMEWVGKIKQQEVCVGAKAEEVALKIREIVAQMLKEGQKVIKKWGKPLSEKKKK